MPQITVQAGTTATLPFAGTYATKLIAAVDYFRPPPPGDTRTGPQRVAAFLKSQLVDLVRAHRIELGKASLECL